MSALLHLVEEGEETGVIRLYQYSGVTGSAASDVDQACQEATREDPPGAYAVDYIRYDVQQTASYYEVDVSLTYRVAPEELSQVISVTASTAVAGELQDLLPHRPQKVIFRIGYFTAEDSAETLRQAVEEAYDAQTIALPPPGGDHREPLPRQRASGGWRRSSSPGGGDHLRSAKFFGDFRKFPLTLLRQCDNISLADASVAHLVERHLAKVEVASSSLVTRSKKEDVR